MFSVCFCLILIAAGTMSASIGDQQKESENYLKELRIVTRIYEDCSKTDWSSCLKIKLASALDRILKNYKVIHLFEGVSFVNEKTATPEDSSENYLEGSRSGEYGGNSLDAVLVDRFIRFLSTYTLHVKLSNLNGIRNSIEEARGKYGGGKKYGYFLFVPLMMFGTILPLAFGALALLAGKALIISKLALLLAGIIGLKKLLSHDHHDHHGHDHHGYQRQFHTMNDISGSLDFNDAQDLAYRGRKL